MTSTGNGCTPGTADLPQFLADVSLFLETLAEVTFNAMFGGDTTWDAAPDWRKQAWRNVKDGQHRAVLTVLRARTATPRSLTCAASPVPNGAP